MDQTLDKVDFEIIVVNNNPPETLDFKFHGNHNLKVVTEKTPGSYAARNRGVAEAKGLILAFTDSDCIPESDWLSNAREIFKEDKEHQIGVLTGPISLFYKDPLKLRPAEVYEKYTAFRTETYAKEGFAVTANWFSYKSVILEFGSFNEKLKSNGDTELSGSIHKKYKVKYSPLILVHHPARYQISELVQKYRRRLGGTYKRSYEGNKVKYALYVLDFIYRRYRFALKKLFTISPKESISIFKACHEINIGAIYEYFDLVSGREAKR